MSRTVAEVLEGVCLVYATEGFRFSVLERTLSELAAAGFVIVPKEPTAEIIRAGAGPHDVGLDPNNATERLIAAGYRAMIAAASQLGS